MEDFFLYLIANPVFLGLVAPGNGRAASNPFIWAPRLQKEIEPMSLIIEAMCQFGLKDRRNDGRFPAHALEARYGTGAQEREVLIRDISATGIFVLTGESLQPDVHTHLTLRRKLIAGKRPSGGVRLRVRAVRQDKTGVGMRFLPHSSTTDSWFDLMDMAAPVARSTDAVEHFRIAKVLSFLASIAAPIHREFAEGMSPCMKPETRERMVAMLLAAEEQLEEWKRPIRHRISQDLMRQILLFGALAEDQRTNSFWQQLLCTSCLAMHKEDESVQLADVLSKLLPIDLELFCAACEMAMAGSWSDSGKIYCTAQDLRTIAHTPNLVIIEQHLHHLFDLGLLEHTVKPLRGEQIGEGNLTITPLGLELYARCAEFPSSFAPAPTLTV